MLLLRLLLGWVYLCLGFGLLALPAESRADAVLLRFKPPPQSVRGYNLYLATATSGAITSPAVDIGARTADSTGVASYSIGNLDPTQSYVVELTAYDSSGVESRRSNRLTLAARTEVLGAPLWQSNFSQYAPGVHVPGFTDLRGDTVTTSGTNIFSVLYLGDGSIAYFSGSDIGVVASQYTGASAAGWGSYEISGRMRMDRPQGRAGIGARVQSGAYFLLGTATNGAWALGGWNEPALTCRVGAALGVTAAARSWYSFKYRVTRASGLTRLRAKVWLQSSAEPTSWQSDCWTSSPVTSDSGSFELIRTGAGGVYWADLVVTAVSGTIAPIPPQ